MKQKYLRVTMPDGSKWDVPAHMIANDRATYYTEKLVGTEKAKEMEYKAEYDYAMSHNDELQDWAANNMNWDDVKDQARMVAQHEMSDDDFQEGWINGEKEMVEK